MHRTFATCFTLLFSLQYINAQHNPSILQDTRYEPKVDGTFGFLYKTEDGIAHGAKSNGDGIISGRFTYTDPTGLKVNFNYNAGSRVTPGYNYEEQNPSYVPKSGAYEEQQGSYEQPQQTYQNQPATYSQPQQEQQTYQQPRAQQTYQQPRAQPAYQPRTRPPSQNEVYSNYN